MIMKKALPKMVPVGSLVGLMMDQAMTLSFLTVRKKTMRLQMKKVKMMLDGSLMIQLTT